MRSEFLLDPEVVFLNHGSFGACPRPVFERYQAWQLELERQPVEFLGRRITDLLADARSELAAFVGAHADDLVFVPNATHGVNVAARALELRSGDEVLTTNLEYGACDLLWEHVCARADARYVRAPVPLPLGRPEQVVDAVFERLTERTRVLFVSHVTSETALVLPVEELVRRGRAAGLTTIVDGAHTPGHIPLDLAALDADFYAGNCHKWLCAPKGAGFLHVRRDLQLDVDALLVGWGYDEEATFLTRHERQATRDPAAYLTVPAAIEWVQANGDHERCRALTAEAQRRLTELDGVETLSPLQFVAQMVSVRVPTPDPDETKRRLYDEHRIEVPVFARKTEPLLRVSIAPYNDESDVDRLVDALPRLLRADS